MLKELVKWSLASYSDLPWRQRRSLYHTLVSEIMLQQTTVSTVLKHFDRFLDVYPTIEALAHSSEEEVCSQWQGLGYYRRARNLRKAAISIVDDFGGEFPTDKEALIKIPGIGDYTAAALLAIGTNKKALAVDANIERVVARLFHLNEEKGIKLQKRIRAGFISGEFSSLEKGVSYRDLNESLMDLGRVFCQARRADCYLCPLNKSCKTYLGKDRENRRGPLDIPVVNEKKKKKEVFELELLRVVVRSGDKIIAKAREEGLWLSGQIEVPTFILSCADKKLDQYPKVKMKKAEREVLPLVKTSITKYKIVNRIIIMSNKEFQRFMEVNGFLEAFQYYLFDSQKHHFSTTTIKSLNKIGVTE